MNRLQDARQRIITADFMISKSHHYSWKQERIEAWAEWHAAVKEWWEAKR